VSWRRSRRAEGRRLLLVASGPRPCYSRLSHEHTSLQPTRST
jgi:hypothetical protein